MTDVLEIASSGRAKCRGCDAPIAKGEWRFGEHEANPYGDGEATYWFHPSCAAFRRPERFLALTSEQTQVLPDATTLRDIAALGIAHHRLPRITHIERAKSGRSTCRHCKSSIAANTVRIVLTIWEQTRFTPMGFIHLGCAVDYFGTTQLEAFFRHVAPSDVWDEPAMREFGETR